MNRYPQHAGQPYRGEGDLWASTVGAIVTTGVVSTLIAVLMFISTL